MRSEVGLVTVLGAILGLAAAWALAEVLVAVLTNVFDPPPEVLSIPWPYLASVALVGLFCAVLATRRAVTSARRPAIEVLRDL